ncbi:MAG: hypothetical protein J1D86_03710 [Alistipes sp.]|nr:hypothetical protein [Alistipes sp.]
MTPQEKQWLESVVSDPEKLRKKIRQYRILIGVLTAGLVASLIVILCCGLKEAWVWLIIIMFAAQIAGNVFSLLETSRLLKAAERIEK